MLLFYESRPDFEYEIRGLLIGFWPGAYTKKSGHALPEADDCRVPAGKENRPEEHYFFRFDYTEEGGTLAGGPLACFYGNAEAGAPVTETFRLSGTRTAQKTSLKQALYAVCARLTGKTLPWGALTGIRPTKIPSAGLAAGKTEAQILSEMTDDHLVSPEKAALALRIAKTEREILSREDFASGYSLYAGIPFCPTRCLYCSFTAYPIGAMRERVEPYLAALEEELSAVPDLVPGKPLQTVYIGGGTPTALSAEEIDRLLSHIRRTFDWSSVREFTVEAGRPDSVTEKKLEVLKKHGVTRISVNPQTMKEETLAIIGRRHTVAQVVEVFETARRMGFDNINMDLILGLPNESEDDVRHTMEAVEALRPDSVTVHSLALKRASRLNLERGKYRNLRFENSEERMRIAAEACARMGLVPYYLYRQKNMAGNFENTGFAAPGKEGLYNMLIMEEIHSIPACGTGVTSKCVDRAAGKITRCDNVKEVDDYIAGIGAMIARKKELFS